MSAWFVVTGFDAMLQCGVVTTVIICFTWVVLGSGLNPLLMQMLWEGKFVDGDVQDVKTLLKRYQVFTNAFVGKSLILSGNAMKA